MLLALVGVVTLGFVLRDATPTSGVPGQSQASSEATTTSSTSRRAEGSPSRDDATTGPGESATSARRPSTPSASGGLDGAPSDASERVSFVEVPSVGIRITVAPGGLSADGTISPPAGTAIWFTGYQRVLPGLVGTSVVAAHVEANGAPDLFARLPELREGAEVRIGYADGDVLELRVVRTRLADKVQIQRDADVWGANGSVRRVALITCDDALGQRADGHNVANFVAIAEPA
ncbi:class F sortase [Janibacter sp. G1551]|uniref:class F sortase n=1 Tax=Janibacter sp. G1551 TaxID=3420440 RepID=UPI003CFDFC53